MHKFILKRLGMMLPVLVGVMFVIFTLTYITPGDPVMMILGDQAAQEDIVNLRAELGLDQPFLVQFGMFVANTMQFNFGTSFTTGRPVLEEIGFRFPTTMQLAAMSVVISVLIGIPLGILSAVKQYTIFDNGATIIGLLGVSIPNFWLGMMLIILFSVNLGWFPTTGFETPMHWVLPSFTIGISSAAIIMRMTRSSMLEVIRQDYIRTARAKGQKESKIIVSHALKNALIPVITVVGLQFGLLLGGAILTETIYAIPGLGRFMVESIQRRDYPIIQGGVLLLALVFSFVNLLVDILYAFVDPRIRSQYK
ncbi:MAG: ABC transporter permease [Defluviitaleaceae bacterium]|nr:ABC transporter permease [Defluviitaleaceae bacterium]